MDLSLHSLTLEAPTERETFKNSRISELPDDILIHILSFVPMKEAGRTSLLSKRWRSVWAYVPYLQFDFPFDGYEALDGESLEESEEEKYWEEEEKYWEEAESKYVCWVDQVVNSHKAPTVDVFKVEYSLGVSRKDNIDNWLRFAVKKRVKRLELLRSPYSSVGDDVDLYTFPTVSFCNLNFLQMEGVRVSGEALEKLLRDCPTLEFLSVKSAYSLVNLKVVGPSLKIKSLEISYCHEIKYLEISAPNLKVFRYCGQKLSLNFNCIPKLAELCISGPYGNYLLSDFLDISSFISQIEVLTIEPTLSEKIKRMQEVFPICTRVKLLNITLNQTSDVQLFHLRFLLNACPILHKFVLTMGTHYQVRITERTRNVEVFPHYRLKVVEINAFYGWNLDTLFVKYLIKSAVSLEKLIIQPSNYCIVIGSPRDGPKITRRSTANANMLRKNLKPGTAFEIRHVE